MSPPVALSAYFLKGVVPQWELSDIYAGMMQFMVLQVIGLLLVLFFRPSRCGCPACCGSEGRRAKTRRAARGNAVVRPAAGRRGREAGRLGHRARWRCCRSWRSTRKACRCTG